MTDYSTYKVKKSILDYNGDDEEKKVNQQNAQEKYLLMLEWYNENANNYDLVDTGTYYEMQAKKQPIQTEEEIKSARIKELRQYLTDTDYIVLKIAEGVATQEDYADVIAKRQEARLEINQLES